MKFYVPNGVVDYRTQVGADINLMVKRDISDRKMMIESGEIIAMVVPMTERKVVIKHHLVSKDEIQRITDQTNPATSFVMSYYKAKKCPFRSSK